MKNDKRRMHIAVRTVVVMLVAVAFASQIVSAQTVAGKSSGTLTPVRDDAGARNGRHEKASHDLAAEAESGGRAAEQEHDPHDPEEPAIDGDAESARLPTQKNTLSDVERARFAVEVKSLVNVRATTVQEIEAVEVRQVRRVALSLNGEERVLELYPHSMRSEDFVVLVQDETGLMHEEDPPPVTTYRGGIIGDITSAVAASIIDGKLYASIETRGDFWAVQPVGDGVVGAPANLHAVYRKSDVIPPGGTCGVEGAFLMQGAAGQGAGGDNAGALGGNTNGRTQIAFDTDVQYYNANGGSVQQTVADIDMIMNQVGELYENQFSPSICYVNEGVIVRTAEPDPYGGSVAANVLCQFRNEWNANDPISNRDTAHLMTGRNLDAPVIGLAWVGVICNRVGIPNACPALTDNLAYALSQTTWSANLINRTQLTAHELGHNWNACHCNQNTCTGGAGDLNCGIMNSFIQGSSVFDWRALGSIEGHRGSRNCLSGCTGTVYVDAANPVTGDGSLGNPYKHLNDGLDWVKVGGTVKMFSGSYTLSGNDRTIAKWLNLEGHNGASNIE